MYLENVVFDAADPWQEGRFWESVLGGENLSDNEGGFETRYAVAGGPVLDLCFQPVPDPREDPPRLHLDLSGVDLDRLLDHGARHLDIGQGEVPWTVLADPEGIAFCLLDDRDQYADAGALAALVLQSADPARDIAFWSWLTGWVEVEGELRSLRHPSLKGPFLELLPEPRTMSAKNRLHLDVRLDTGDDADEVEAAILERGGRRELHPEWGQLPWRSYADPSGNELCVLPSR